MKTTLAKTFSLIVAGFVFVLCLAQPAQAQWRDPLNRNAIITYKSQTLTDGATVSWDTSLGQVATVTLGGNRTLAAPTNLGVGNYILNVVQDGTGSRTVTWNSVFKWASGIAPKLTTTAAARDIISCVSDGTNLYCGMIGDVK